MTQSNQSQSFQPDRLREMRVRRSLTQEQLATQAKVRKETIYRLEKGQQRNPRKRTIDSLSAALGVPANVLTGERPLPVDDRPKAEEGNDGRYQLGARVSAQVRNAFSLVALRYQIPPSRIAELAPFLFVLAAEESFEWRRKNLGELLDLFDREEETRNAFSYLPELQVSSNIRDDEALSREQRSIDTRDLLARKTNRRVLVDVDDQNPFVAYLRSNAAKRDSVAKIYSFGQASSSYTVCEDDALRMACNDQELALGIINGWALLHEMPTELRSDAKAAERLAWLRSRIEPVQQRNRDLLREWGMSPREEEAKP